MIFVSLEQQCICLRKSSFHLVTLVGEHIWLLKLLHKIVHLSAVILLSYF